jgi:hypothetical protein
LRRISDRTSADGGGEIGGGGGSPVARERGRREKEWKERKGRETVCQFKFTLVAPIKLE